MEVQICDYFSHPTSMLISGNSGSGKSTFVANLIRKGKIVPNPQRIVWFYKQHQALYDELLAEGHVIEFVEGLPDEISQPGYFNKELRNLCVIDDLHLEEKTSKHVAQLFCNGGRHSNTTVIFLTQNLFFKQSFSRDIRLNAKVIVSFKNPQDRQQLQNLGRQIFPQKQLYFTTAVDHALERPHGYIVIDLQHGTPDKFRLKTCIFGENKYAAPEVYMQL
jgi:Poxvirus A32 protein